MWMIPSNGCHGRSAAEQLSALKGTRLFAAAYAIALMPGLCRGAVRVSVLDLSPAHGRVRAKSGAVPTLGFDVVTTAGERLRLVRFTVVGRGAIVPELSHFLPKDTSWLDKARRLRGRSGFAVYHCSRDDRFYADSVLPGMNDFPVTLDAPEAIDVSRWPQVRIAMPEELPETMGRVRYCLVIRTSKRAPHGMRFRVRLDGIEFDRSGPWLFPAATRLLVLDTKPPEIEVRLKPRPQVRAGELVRFRLTADEPLACPPQLRVLRPDYSPVDLARGAPMQRVADAYVAAFRPLALLTQNGRTASPPIRYTNYPKPIPRYRDDGRCLINGDCRYSWLAKGAVTWRNTERVEITFDLGGDHAVEMARAYVSSAMSGVNMAVATAAVVKGPWSDDTPAALPKFGRGHAFNPPLNIIEASLVPRPARWVRLRLTGQTSIQITEVEILGDRDRAPVGKYFAKFRVCDQALNQARNANIAFEVTAR